MLFTEWSRIRLVCLFVSAFMSANQRFCFLFSSPLYNMVMKQWYEIYVFIHSEGHISQRYLQMAPMACPHRVKCVVWVQQNLIYFLHLSLPTFHTVFILKQWYALYVSLPDNKEPHVNIDQTSIRHLHVGSISYRCRSEGFYYLGNILINRLYTKALYWAKQNLTTSNLQIQGPCTNETPNCLKMSWHWVAIKKKCGNNKDRHAFFKTTMTIDESHYSRWPMTSRQTLKPFNS